MSRPVTVSVPHKLGRDEARRRIEQGFGQIQSQMAGGLGLVACHERWEGDRLHFEASAVGQKMTGRLDVNEEAWIGRCISAIHGSMAVIGDSYEVIVGDDASTDATARIATEHGAEVIRVEHRHISATRNAGGQHSRGDILFFVDADTLVSAAVVQEAIDCIRAGAVGGGCVPRFEERLPLWWRLVYPALVCGGRLARLVGGACQFCTREAFVATGGFSEEHYAAEDLVFLAALKQHGRVVVLAEPVVTSGRSLRNQSFWTIGRLLSRLAFLGPDGFRERTDAHMWYEVKREG